LIEYLPQKILVANAEKIAPVVIYQTVKHDGKMVEESMEKYHIMDQFDYGKTELITKLTINLPEISLITYVIPYCLNFLKLAAISCQKQTSIPY
jgi:hypothetical protein